ncbi:TPA: hypothetical protein ACYVCL_002170 [Klebsiella pneumoniae]|uniref:hypothetical protein n=1 Tax=Klebsiella pneumoniae TaxID=573 RepID=UPI0013993887|nr:hypothetical protein [Klebsiella pneumoniae]QHW96137.1 hypothetical protein GZS05_06710 [Klebsiella variicola]HBS6250293.1 hypothetical protein [Klebsiella pneumoniae]
MSSYSIIEGGGMMQIIYKKEQKGIYLFLKMLITVLITHYFGIEWGLLYIAAINPLPSLLIKPN